MNTTYLLGGILLVAIAVAASVTFAALRTRRGHEQQQQMAATLATERVSVASQIQTLNEHLKHKAQALQSANSELESFSYSVAHDLRTPLRAIGSYANMLREDFAPQLPEEAARYIQVICAEVSRMEHLIADLLAFSSLGRTALNMEQHNPRAAVMRACKEVLTNHATAMPDIVVGDLPDALADSALMDHVWSNLIDNAVKYSSKTPGARVEIGGRIEDRQSVYFVKDNGAGFDMRYADKLFGVFERLHGQEEFPGTGVGLAIVKRVVTRQGGRAWAHGEPGQGAMFYFSLPRE